MDNFFDTYSGIKELQKNILGSWNKRGFIYNLFDRPLFLPTKERSQKGLNYLLQSSASDYCLFKQLEVDKALNQAGIKYNLTNLVHDGILYEVDKSQGEAALKIIQDVLTQQTNLRVPLKVDINIKSRWS